MSKHNSSAKSPVPTVTAQPPNSSPIVSGGFSFRSIIRVIGSLWFAAVILVLLLVAMACATVYETTHGTEQAAIEFYKSRWFTGLLVLLGINAVYALIFRYPFTRKQLGFVVTHGSILLVLIGALATYYFGVDGQVALNEGQTTGEYAVSKDALTVVNPKTRAKASTVFDPLAGGRLQIIDKPAASPLILGEVKVEVKQYLPDAVSQQRVHNDNSTLRPAVEISFSESGTENPMWAFADETSGGTANVIRFRTLASKEELDRILNPPATTQPAGSGTVRVEYQNSQFEVPVDGNIGKDVKVEGTDLTVHILRYLPHAVVGDNREIVNASDQPINPAVEVRATSPAGNETRLAFARFPEFSSMHGRKEAIGGLKMIFVRATSEPKVPIEVFAGPSGELHVRFSPDGTTQTTHPLELAKPIETPWSGHRFAVLRRFDRARTEWILVPVTPIRADRQPGMHLNVSWPGGSTEVWLQKYSTQAVSAGATPVELTYANQTFPLGFDVTLNRFTIGYYPGSNQPRSYESQVTFREPAVGEDLNQVIRMNHPAVYRGFTFYQSSYNQQGGRNTSILSVSWDPGQWIVFCGYVGLMAGMVIIAATKMKRKTVE